jgi:uncharacterized protein (TIGR02001 family)
MRRSILAATAAATATAAVILSVPAHAQEMDHAPAVTVSGSVALVSDYRRRGVSWSDTDPALVADVDVAHRSGAYLAVKAATVRGWGSAGGSDVGLDLVAGWRFAALGGDIDAGIGYYTFPGGLPRSDFAELHTRYSGTIGPLFLRGGVAWAPLQRSLGRWYDSGAAFRAGTAQRRRGDNLYLEADASAFIPGTPVTIAAHVGHSRGNAGLGPAGTSLAPTGRYWDWRIGAEAVQGPITFGLAWVATDIDAAGAAARRLAPAFARGRDGAPIAGSGVVLTLSASF